MMTRNNQAGYCNAINLSRDQPESDAQLHNYKKYKENFVILQSIGII